MAVGRDAGLFSAFRSNRCSVYVRSSFRMSDNNIILNKIYIHKSRFRAWGKASKTAPCAGEEIRASLSIYRGLVFCSAQATERRESSVRRRWWPQATIGINNTLFLVLLEVLSFLPVKTPGRTMVRLHVCGSLANVPLCRTKAHGSLLWVLKTFFKLSVYFAFNKILRKHSWEIMCSANVYDVEWLTAVFKIHPMQLN